MKPQRSTSAPRQQAAAASVPEAAGGKGKGKAKPRAGKSAAAAPRRQTSLQQELDAQKQALVEAQELLKAQNEKLRAAQGEIEATLQRYAGLYDYAPVGYATLDAKGRIEQINLAGARLLGRERQYLVRVGFANFIANRKDRELFHDYLQRCREAEAPDEVVCTELQLRSRTGQVRLVQLSTRPAAEAMAGSYLVAIFDITRTRAAENALRGSEERLTTVLSAAMDAIITVDEDQHIVFFNAAAEGMFHRPAEEVMGQPLSLLLAEQFRPGHDRHIRIFAEAGAMSELRGLSADGSEFPVEASISQALSSSGRFFTVILRNISERKAREGDELFLLQLGEHIRMATGGGEMVDQVAKRLSGHLRVGRCFLARVDAARDEFTLAGGYHLEGLPAMTGRHVMGAFSAEVVKEVLAGRTVCVTDVTADPRTAGHEASYAELDIGAYMVVPLMGDGGLLAVMVMTTTGSRAWSKMEVSLLATVAERVWLALEKFRLDEELRVSAARFREMAERVPVFIFTTTATGECDYVNQRYLDYTGMTAAAAHGSGWQEALHPDERMPFSASWQKSMQECTAFEAACRCRAADGSHRWFRSTANPVLDERGGITKWFGSYVDIDDLMRAQAELALVNERLEEWVMERTAQLATANKELHREFKERQRLEHEITEVSERERRSLGQALHDGVCQHLSGVGMMAATLSDVCDQRCDPETAAKLREITGLIRSATIDAREVARGLNPVDVDADGLVAALRDLSARYDVPGQTRCVLHCHEPVPVHDNNAAMHLYRIAQEAVVNASRHAQARHISVHLGIRQQDIMLSITDDGNGLPADIDQSAGLGLTLMRYRASSIGATLTITARQAGGTVVRCCLPTPI